MEDGRHGEYQTSPQRRTAKVQMENCEVPDTLRYEIHDECGGVDDQYRLSNCGQRLADDPVKVDHTQGCCQGQECVLPLLTVVRRVILRGHSLHERTSDGFYSYEERLPASTYKPALVISKRWWADDFNAATYLGHSSKTIVKLEERAWKPSCIVHWALGPF